MRKTLMVVVSILALIVVLSVSACASLGTAKKLVTDTDYLEEYQVLVTDYQNAQEAAANGNTCIALQYNAMVNTAQLANNYMVGVAKQTEAYRKPLAEFGNKLNKASSDLNGLQQAYTDPNTGAPIPSNKLDLSDLVAKNATPAGLALQLQVYANTFNEAPIPALNSQPVENAQRTVNAAMNQSFACVKDWNSAVKNYNVERNKIAGDVAGHLANALHVKELPESLPYYQVVAPSQPPAIPTLAP